MALTPEQISAVRIATGRSATPTQAGSTGSLADDLNSAWQTATPQTGYLGRASNTMAAGADMAGNAFKTGASELMQHTGDALNEAQDKALPEQILIGLKEAGNWAGTIAKTAVGVGTAAAKAAVAPVSQIKTSEGDTVGDRFAKPIEQKAQDVEAFSQAHPEVTDWWNKLDPSIKQGISNVVNTVGLTGAGKLADTEVPALTDLASSVKNTATDAVQGTKDIGSAVAQKATDTLNSVKDSAASLGKMGKETPLETATRLTSPTLYKKDTISSMEQAGSPGGAQKTGFLGTYKPAPTAKDIEVAKSVQGLVKDQAPLENIVNINEEIGRVSDELGSHFAQNKVPFNFEDLRKASDLIKPDASLTGDPAAVSTYSRVKENLLSSMYNHLKNAAKESGDFGGETDMGQVWKARIAIDQQIEKELGATTFDSPQYKGVKAAAQDFRNGFNKFIADNVANPGEMGQVNKMHEFIQEARARGIEIPSEEEGMNILRKQFGLTSPVDQASARAAIFQDSMDRLSKMYEARGNIAESNWRLMDKNTIQRWIKMNPGKAKLLKYGIGLAGVGALGHFVAP